MKISIEYKLKNSDTIHSITLTPEEYFYEGSVENKNFEEEGISKYDDPKTYIEDSIDSINLYAIEYITETISDSIKSDKVMTTYYFGDESTILTRKDSDGFELVVQSFKIATNCIMISRMTRNKASEDWHLITCVAGLNYEVHHDGEEKWYSLKHGEFLHVTIENNKL